MKFARAVPRDFTKIARSSALSPSNQSSSTPVESPAFFNIANLVPVWKFDGGQVLRQICPGPLVLATASFATLSAFLALGRLTGLTGKDEVVWLRACLKACTLLEERPSDHRSGQGGPPTPS